MDTSPAMVPQSRKPIIPQPTSPTRFAHFVVRTSKPKLEEMGRWYQTVLDARIGTEITSRYLHGEEFKENPIGVSFDTGEFVRAYEARMAEDELMRRPGGDPGRTHSIGGPL